MLEVALSVVIFVAAVVASGHAVASKPRIFRLIPSIFPLVSLWKKTAGVAAKPGDLLHAEELLQQATDLLQTAHRILADDHAYDALLATMKRALRDAAVAVKTQRRMHGQRWTGSSSRLTSL